MSEEKTLLCLLEDEWVKEGLAIQDTKDAVQGLVQSYFAIPSTMRPDLKRRTIIRLRGERTLLRFVEWVENGLATQTVKDGAIFLVNSYLSRMYYESQREKEADG